VGSFFKNPVLEAERAEAVAKAFPDLVQFDVAGGKKLSAAWLIDQMGLKGYRVGRFVVSDKHALVIINEGDGTQLELFELVGVVKQKVKHTFGIDLEIEPRIYPDGFDVSY
jgi:UDP-N-acetylmuramate dehydrogenase